MSFLKSFNQNLCLFVSMVLAVLLLVQPFAIAQSIDDRADLLNWQTEFNLNLRINKLVGRTSAELAIATIPKIETAQSPRAFAIKLFNILGIGKKKTNNGVLLFVSKNDRRIEIITGKGLGQIDIDHN